MTSSTIIFPKKSSDLIFLLKVGGNSFELFSSKEEAVGERLTAIQTKIDGLQVVNNNQLKMKYQDRWFVGSLNQIQKDTKR